jgi:hypothetical protein
MPAIRVKTPNLFSTRMEMVCRMGENMFLFSDASLEDAEKREE